MNEGMTFHVTGKTDGVSAGYVDVSRAPSGLLIDTKSEAEHGAKVKILRDLWIADARPEYEFWAIMMATYTGLWPAAAINEKAA